jgi:hypothetical protein
MTDFLCFDPKVSLLQFCPNILETTYILRTLEKRSDVYFILSKVGGAKMLTPMLHDYRACPVFPLRYDCLRHAQQILKYALSKGPQD